jgi:LCP family protein required for cell wall assembly
VIVIIALLFIYKVISTAFFYVSHFSPSDIFFILAGDVQMDEMNRTNVLLLGTGGGEHDAPDLTDTIMVASYNHNTEIGSMLSIPRDFFVKIPGYGQSRINKIYENLKPHYGSQKAIEVLKDSAEIITNLDIPYYVKVDFEGFEDVVDILDGVEIDVKKPIQDDYYPDDNFGFEPFYLEAGLQHMDGETALKYARSRHSTSDFDRAQRQQQLLVAIKDKAISMNLLTSSSTLKKLWGAFNEHIETNMSFKDIVAFGRIAKSFDTSKVVSKVLRDIEIVQEGGFLYTPEREFYGGAFVLRPWGETYDDIHKYASLVFETPEMFLENSRIEIQNGSGIPGAASTLMDYLIPYGFNIVRIGNTPGAQDYAQSHYSGINPDEHSWTLQRLGEILPKGRKISAPQTYPNGEDIDIIIVVGEDFPNSY